LRAAVVQLNSTADKDRNLAAAERLVRAAAADGATLVALPEKWNLLAAGPELLAGAEPLDGPTLTAARGWARELGIHLLAGSVSEQGPGDKAFNTSVLIGPDGDDLAAYRKIHMFDVDVDGIAYRESDHEEPGEEIVVAPLPQASLGLSVCYDLRFPELYRILAVRGARIVAVPSAFTLATGARGRSRTRCSSSLPTRSARRRRTSAPMAARRSSIPGASSSPPPPTRRASPPPTSTSPRRSASARASLRSPIAARRPTPGRS
jgi:predicted amidohydrolase